MNVPGITKIRAYQMEPPSPTQALGVNPFLSRFINVTLHGKTVNKVIARARHGPNPFARYLSNTLSVRICKKKQKK